MPNVKKEDISTPGFSAGHPTTNQSKRCYFAFNYAHKCAEDLGDDHPRFVYAWFGPIPPESGHSVSHRADGLRNCGVNNGL